MSSGERKSENWTLIRSKLSFEEECLTENRRFFQGTCKSYKFNVRTIISPDVNPRGFTVKKQINLGTNLNIDFKNAGIYNS